LTIHEFTTDLHTLEITLLNGIVITAEGVAQTLSDDVSNSLIAGDVAFTFEMQEPFFKSSQQYQQDIYLTSGGGSEVPMAIPLDMTAGASGFTNISQTGNVFCYPEIYFYGKLTNPVLTNVTLGKTISLAVSLADATKWYYVDTYNRIVTDQDDANVRDDMTGDFLVIATGNNEFSLTTNDMSETGFVRLIYKDYYISI